MQVDTVKNNNVEILFVNIHRKSLEYLKIYYEDFFYSRIQVIRNSKIPVSESRSYKKLRCNEAKSKIAREHANFCPSNRINRHIRQRTKNFFFACPFISSLNSLGKLINTPSCKSIDTFGYIEHAGKEFKLLKYYFIHFFLPWDQILNINL